MSDARFWGKIYYGILIFREIVVKKNEIFLKYVYNYFMREFAI